MTTLTNLSIKNIEPAEGRQEIPDGGCRGLYLIVQPTGRRTWAVRYRFAGKTRKMTLDGALGLAEARKAATAALHAVETGVDPAAVKLQIEAERGGDTVERLAADYVERHVKKKTRPSTQKATIGVFDNIVLPAWRGRTVHDVKRRDVIELVDRVADSRGPHMANRTAAALSKWFNWMLSRAVLESSPCVKLPHPGVNKPRERSLSDDEVAKLLRACDDLDPPLGDIYRLALLTGGRRREVLEMRWREVDGDKWMLPAERSKNGYKHLFPLSRQARKIIEAQPRVAGSDYVFGHVRSLGHPKEKLDAAMRTNEPWTMHDLRRTMTAALQKLKVDWEVRESMLGHKLPGIAGVYNVYRYADEKAEAYQLWADHVDKLAAVGGRLRVVK
jgi:integrase